MRTRLGLEDYAGSSILDVGCAVRIPATLLNLDMPVRRYVGLDVDAEPIRFLNEVVSDERFAFHHLDVYNQFYNRDGRPLSYDFRFPVDENFNLACLFSVFTHLNPLDTDCMLHALRQVIDPAGKLICTFLLDDTVQAFDDRQPEKPLHHAAYTEAFVRHLFERTGWAVETLHPPTEGSKDFMLMQSCFVCLPSEPR